MTRFLRTDDGELINADRIERIVRSRATLIDGTGVTLASDTDEIELALLPFVAAAPGYMHLRHYDDGGGPWIERLPIVAWRIDADIARPVGRSSARRAGRGAIRPDLSRRSDVASGNGRAGEEPARD
jgi:hypothetical protein